MLPRGGRGESSITKIEEAASDTVADLWGLVLTDRMDADWIGGQRFTDSTREWCAFYYAIKQIIFRSPDILVRRNFYILTNSEYCIRPLRTTRSKDGATRS